MASSLYSPLAAARLAQCQMRRRPLQKCTTALLTSSSASEAWDKLSCSEIEYMRISKPKLKHSNSFYFFFFFLSQLISFLLVFYFYSAYHLFRHSHKTDLWKFACRFSYTRCQGPRSPVWFLSSGVSRVLLASVWDSSGLGLGFLPLHEKQ